MKRKLTFGDGDDLHNKRRKAGNESNALMSHAILDFDPKYFLRCHSKGNDDADVTTQVWHCAFEPQNPMLVATCGGNSVCFINVDLGDVQAKYCTDIQDNLYTLAWTTITSHLKQENVLAVSGASKYIHLLHPKLNVVFFKYNLRKSLGSSRRFKPVSSLLFHPFEKSTLFCSQEDEEVIIFDIGCPVPPEYHTTFDKLYVLSAKTVIYSLAFSSELNILLAACKDGLRGWEIGNQEKMESTPLLTFDHPLMPDQKLSEEKLIDSVEVLDNGLVATKCALHGNIYVWNLKDTVDTAQNMHTFNVAPSYVLRWSDTDNCFMYMGCNKSFLACGDDKGALWMYDILNFAQKNHSNEAKDVKPTLVLPWPEVGDEYLERKRKVRYESNNIVINKVALNNVGSHIVAVTHNNLVCIWKKMDS